jgi:hypothetical protein
MNQVQYPSQVVLLSTSIADDVSKTPGLFSGIWLHRTSVKKLVLEKGWNPISNKNSIYGTAVYLSGDEWDLEDSSLLDLCLNGTPNPMDYASVLEIIRCELVLEDSEVQSFFHSTHQPFGTDQTHLLWHLKENGVGASRSPSLGSSRQNRSIASYFLGKGIKAILFKEENIEVVAVFDPSCIRVRSS